MNNTGNRTAVLATITAATILLLAHKGKELKNNKKKICKKRKWWVRPIFTEDNRMQHGAHILLDEMRLNDLESFFNFTRMSPASFDKLLGIVGPTLTKQNVVRNSIPASTKLALTLR